MVYADRAKRRAQARRAANIRHAKGDRKNSTKAARAGFLARFMSEAREYAGPNATEAEIAARAQNLLDAHMLGLRLAQMNAADRRKTKRP